MAALSRPKSEGSWLNQDRKWFPIVIAISIVAALYLVTMSGGTPVQLEEVQTKDQVVTIPQQHNAPAPVVAPAPLTPAPVAATPVAPPKTPQPVAAPVSAPVISTQPPQTEQPKEKTESSQNDVTTIDAIRRNYQTARHYMSEKLKQDYGEDNYQGIFFDDATGRPRCIFQTPNEKGPSRKQFREKLVLKLLQVLDPTKQNNSTSKFVWATGGHSSTAGHGNFFDESYTAVLEKAAKPLFTAVGIQFEARNYAMGGTEAAPEAAWCMEEIFGTDDLDLVVWDYGMTDGRDMNKMRLYCYRVGMNVNRPACVGFHFGGRPEKMRQRVLAELEDRGMTTFFAPESQLKAADDAVPDSAGKTNEEVEKMPPFVRNYKCGNQIEAGEPFCATEKFNNTMCTERKFRVKWHPGWKYHALQGNLAAFFLADVLQEAIDDIVNNNPSTYHLLRAELKINSDTLYEKFKKAELPEEAEQTFNDGHGNIKMEDVYKSPNFCHTARLPAEIRHKGILTESPPGDMFHYVDGVSIRDAERTPNDSDLLRLVRDDGNRQKCEARLNIDYKDFFYVHQKDGFKKLVLPNDRELEEYGSAGQELKGLVAICLAVCPWGKCPKGNLLTDDFDPEENPSFEILVNGSPVIGYTKLAHCSFLKGFSGHYWPLNKEGRYEIKVRAKAEGTFLRIGAFVVW